MKTNTFAAGASAVALCAAAFALATPTHAQAWVFQGSVHGDLKTNDEESSGGPTYTTPTVANGGLSNYSLTASAGGTGAQVINNETPFASCNYDLPFTVTYVWQGGGTPTTTVSVTETDTLTANVTLPGLESATASVGVDGTNETAGAFITPGNPHNTTSDTPKPFVQNYNRPASGATCQFNASVNASAAGYVLVGTKFTSKAVATVAFK